MMSVTAAVSVSAHTAATQVPYSLGFCCCGLVIMKISGLAEVPFVSEVHVPNGDLLSHALLDCTAPKDSDSSIAAHKGTL